nr:set domain-containing protein 5 [Quercus suber]
MGAHAGFDMVPRLTTSASDRRKWKSFLQAVRKAFGDISVFEDKTDYYMFNGCEHQTFPKRGGWFLRFSSRNAEDNQAHGLNRKIAAIAKERFGCRVHEWDENTSASGFYDWPTVIESRRKYLEPEAVVAPDAVATVESREKSRGVPRYPHLSVREVPDKGLGMVSRVKISKGSRIIAEKCLLSTEETSIKALEPSLWVEFDSLPNEKRSLYLSLCNSHPRISPMRGIFETNALPCGPDSDLRAVFFGISRINHSCAANCHYNWNPHREIGTIHAMRDIPAGEELTICYVERGKSKIRQKELKEAFGFDCGCELCDTYKPDVFCGDVKQELLQSLDRDIDDPEHVLNAVSAKCLADCLKYLKAFREEYLDIASPDLARLYHYAFLISIANGDKARAAAFAGRAYEMRRACEGEDSPETARMKAYMEDPARHDFYVRCSKNWSSELASTPQGLNDHFFNEWLWARKRLR